MIKLSGADGSPRKASHVRPRQLQRVVRQQLIVYCIGLSIAAGVAVASQPVTKKRQQE